MATLKQIQDDRHKWKKITGTGTAPYNPARYELKEKYKEEQRKQLKKTTTPPKTKRVDKPTTTTPTKKSTRSNLEKLRARATETGPSTRLYSAVAEGSKRAERARERKRETKETPFGIKTQKGRAMLSDAAKEQLKRRKAARQASIRERTPVTTKTLKPLARQVYKKSIGPTIPRYSPEAREKLKQLVDENEREKERKRNEEFSLSVEKTGGKVSRRSGGKVEKWQGGNLEVSQFYD